MTAEEKVAYTKGYNEAIRWRDPKEEPPTNQDIVLVKTDNDCYATAYFHGKASGFICYGEDAYVEFGEIIVWRPIEWLKIKAMREIEFKAKRVDDGVSLLGNK